MQPYFVEDLHGAASISTCPHLNNPLSRPFHLLKGDSRRHRNGPQSTGRPWETLQPSPIIEFRILLLNQALIVDDHVIDAIDWVWCLGLRGDLPSPGDVAAAVPDVEGVDDDFGLEDALPVVEGCLVGEGYGTELGMLVLM